MKHFEITKTFCNFETVTVTTFEQAMILKHFEITKFQSCLQ
jgi:hypothetical protein